MSERLERAALRLIEEWCKRAQYPIVACSFGKDSLALLHLVRRVQEDVPVLFFYEEFQPDKIAFARSVIAAWGLQVHTYEPSKMELIAGGGEVELIRRQELGEGACFYMPIGTNPGFGADYVCGVEVLQRPVTEDAQYCWDATFIGHRSADVDPVYGQMPLADYAAKAGHTTLVYPLRDWQTADVWAYTERHGVPYNERRYDRERGYQERAERAFNNDYYDICTRCFSPFAAPRVFCPKLGAEMANHAAVIDWEGQKRKWKFVNIEPLRA